MIGTISTLKNDTCAEARHTKPADKHSHTYGKETKLTDDVLEEVAIPFRADETNYMYMCIIIHIISN